jgi:hypothetical protein
VPMLSDTFASYRMYQRLASAFNSIGL